MAETINKKHVHVELSVDRRTYNYTLAATGVPFYEYDSDTDITTTDAWTEYGAIVAAVSTAAATPGDLVSFPAPISADYMTFNMLSTNTDDPSLDIKKYVSVIGTQVTTIELIETPWRSLPIR
jgi:hypothetical protein